MTTCGHALTGMDTLTDTAHATDTEHGMADEQRSQTTRRRLPLGLQAGIVLAFVAVAAGIASILWQPEPGPPGDASAEAGFARDMSTHHAQAVDMALTIRDRTEDERLRQFAIDIVLTQQAQIGMMAGWLQLWELRPTGYEPPMAWMGHDNHSSGGSSGVLMPGMATPQQLAELQSLPVDEAEILFLQLMIAHHLGGVDMARALLERSDNDVVVNLAQSIIDGQQAEIELMNAWLADRLAQ